MQQLTKHLLPLLTLSSICLLGSACHNTASPYKTNQKSFDKAVMQLEQDGIKVIDLGQTIRLTFPSDQFFYGNNTTLFEDKTVALEDVANFARHYPQAKITIVGYTDNVLPNHEAKAISLAQAEAIAGFLWNDGLPSTRMHVEGKGYVAPINSTDSPKAGAQNRRVEMFISPAE